MLFIFDMGGVVTSNFVYSGKSQFFDKLSISAEEFNLLSGKAGFHELETGQISVKEFWKNYNDIISKDCPELPQAQNDLFRLYFHPELNTGTVELINNLKKKHRLVCGTNTIDSHWENHMERGDYAFFNQTYASNKIGCAKPDPHFFQLILEAENTSAENAFFTDDKAENVAAAASLGIHAEVFTTAADLTEKWKKYF